MMILTKRNRADLPALYANEKKDADETKVPVKFFNPCGAGTWYATEFDGDDMFFGLACIHEPELGYFSLSELESIELPLGMKIERDMHWNPRRTLAEAMNIESAIAY